MSDRRLFALSDPHLSLSGAKPMDVFGWRWDDHVERLRTNWLAEVGPDDLVLVPGDISWGMRVEEALPDVRWLAGLPGRKALLRGNHDYWWQSVKKLRALGLPGMYFIQNDSALIDGIAIGGSRMWDFPGIHWSYERNTGTGGEIIAGKAKRGEDDDKIRERELGRLDLSLRSMSPDATLRVAMTHYPPLGEDGQPTAVTEVISRHKVDICVFGHAHAVPEETVGEVTLDGTRYVLASSDYLEHRPKFLTTF